MTFADLGPLIPLLILFAAPVAVLMVIACYRNHGLTVAVTLASLAASLLFLVVGANNTPGQVTELLVVDGYSVFFVGLILAAAIVVVALSYSYLESGTQRKEEYYSLLLTATLGAAVLVESSHFASLFLGLEILGISLYALIGYQRERGTSVEASMKYLILAAVSSAFLLFGIALIYGMTGTLQFGEIAQTNRFSQPLFVLGICAFIVGLGFKLALVPFHMWTPDVYQGAPTPVTAFVASVSKGAVLVLILRFFTEMRIDTYPSLLLIFSIIAVLSMFVGNLLALMQDNVKRLLAYSSIAHLGYLLVAFIATGSMAYIAVGFYLVAYFVTILGAFGVVCMLSGPEGDAELIDDYRALGSRRPMLAAMFTAMLLSLAGMPLTAGFIGKFYLVTAGIGSSLWVLVMSLVVTSVIGLYYYIRVIFVMYANPVQEEISVCKSQSAPVLAWAALFALLSALAVLGLYPGPMIDVIQNTVRTLE